MGARLWSYVTRAIGTLSAGATMQSDSMLISRLRLHEGVKLKPYLDTVNKLTIGCGRNLTDCGISEDEVSYLLQNDIAKVAAQLRPHPWFKALDPVRQDACIELGFNLGVPGFLGFHDTIGALAAKQYDLATTHLTDSKWAKQVGSARVTDICYRLRTGTYPPA